MQDAMRLARRREVTVDFNGGRIAAEWRLRADAVDDVGFENQAVGMEPPTNRCAMSDWLAVKISCSEYGCDLRRDSPIAGSLLGSHSPRRRLP